ncbi:MAG: hypothetical protein KAU20_07215, partial [Nanoarchaeota archaeon]|nr:hypothetical protein [Nanoarchaeota archaeon]
GVSTTAALADKPMVVTTYGEVKDVKTDQWLVNSVLYASSVAGDLTDIRPETNARIIAEVLVSHATEGVLSINTVQNLSLEKESSVFTSRVVYLTGEPDGANYFASESVGSVPTVTSVVTVPNNTIASLPIYHTGDSPQQVDRTIVKGERTATLSYMVNSVQGQEKFYIEAYLVDDLGALVAAPTGLPVGSLGVVPIGVLESPILNTITANQENTIELRGQVPVDVVLPTDYTVRYQIRCEKVGATGGDKTFILYFGSDHDSKVIGLGILTTDTIQNTSGVTGATTTEALNTLDNKFGEYVTIDTAQTITGEKTFTKDVIIRDAKKISVVSGVINLPEGHLYSDKLRMIDDFGAYSDTLPDRVEYSFGGNSLEVKRPDVLSGAHVQTWQDKTGDIALLSDVEAVSDRVDVLEGKVDVLEENISQKNLSYGESYIQNYRSRVLDDGATYFPNEGGYDYALMRERGLDQDVSLMLTPSAVK